MTQIFEGIRVIDLTQGMAGPLVTMMLADYGADVIRLEPPGGDPVWDHPAYLLWQRSKRSVAIDWDTTEGRAQARSLIEGADIFIETLGPGSANALGLDYAQMATRNPALITCAFTAFGESGPLRDLKPYDGIVNARTGRMRDQVGWQRDRPTFRAVNDVSYHSAMFTFQALVAALRVRAMTGLGMPGSYTKTRIAGKSVSWCLQSLRPSRSPRRRALLAPCPGRLLLRHALSTG